MICSSVQAGSHVSFAPEDMEQLHAGEGLYQMWALVNNSPVSLGLFNVDQDGVNLNGPDGSPIDGFDTTLNLLADASELWVTAEPEGFTDDGVPAHPLLAGNLVSGSATLSSSHVHGMGVSFATASGSYILLTPTTSDPNDFMNGVWFMTSTTPRQASLNLPLLSGGAFGWQYQGWIADVASADPIPFSTGEFLNSSSSDLDGGGTCTGGTETAPSFPGQDYVNNCPGLPYQPVLNDGTWSIVMTVEPAPNTGPNPFGFKPLQIPVIPAGTGANQSRNLNNTSSALPRGTATVVPTAVDAATWGAIKNVYR
jgi:hypothetical protein